VTAKGFYEEGAAPARGDHHADRADVGFALEPRAEASCAKTGHAKTGGAKTEPWHTRLFRFARSAMVGGAATLVDLGVLEICVRILHITATTAKIPSFLVALLVQFIGNRTYTFHATSGGLRRQVLLFCGVESVTLFLHWLLFRLCVNTLHLPIEIANFLVSFVVYVGFSYPAWKLVFRGQGGQDGQGAQSGKARHQGAGDGGEGASA
jgi:putative flippase GtrA